MKKQSQDQVIPYSKARRFMEEAIRSTHNKPMMHGLLEVDVTKARAYLRGVKARTGESPSFTAFAIACLGRAVYEHREVHALQQGRKHLILFADVDVSNAVGWFTTLYPLSIELPAAVELKVVETEPGLKSATASSVTKPAKTETGLVVQVPPFINEGETIKVDTAEGVYLSRA